MNLIILANSGTHPIFIEHDIDAVPFRHKDLELWRNNFQGIRYKSIKHNYDFVGQWMMFGRKKW